MMEEDSSAVPQERQEIMQNVESRMQTLGMPVQDYGK